MARIHLVISSMVLVLLGLFATAAMANDIDSAKATVTCTSYALTVSAEDLGPGHHYTIDYTITLTPTSGPVITVTGSIPFIAPANGKFTTTVTKPLGPLTGDYTLSGSATLVGFNTIAIKFSPGSINCGAPQPEVTTANATVTCTSYTLAVSADDLVPSQSYTIDYTIILTPTSGTPITVTGSIPFIAPSNGKFNTTVTKPLGPLTADYTLTGSATLVGFNTIPIVFSPDTVNCSSPPPPPCMAQSTNASNFNGTPISAGDYIWFNANFTASGIPSNGVTVTLTKSTISFTAGATEYNLMVPNAQVTFSPTATCTSTSFDSITNTWMTTVPISGDDEIFLTGLAWPVPIGGLNGGISPVTWEGTFSTLTDTPGVSMNWKWGAAVYSTFTTDYNALAIKPAHNSACGTKNGDHAGTPEGVNNNNQQWKQFVVGGAGGGGGSNWTGSWSGTINVVPICQ